MHITLRYYEDCPHWELARDRLESVLDELGRADVTLRLEPVTTEERAEAIGLRGSPTVLVDGHDPFEDPDAPLGPSCRRYQTEDGIEAAPSTAQLRAAIASRDRHTSKGDRQ